MKPENVNARALLLLAVGIVICITLYWPGLAGPLVLDDQGNLSDVTRYLEGDKTAWAVIWDNRSGRLGRPVSMATFVADAWLWGDSTWHAKRTNLLIHVSNGILVFLLLVPLLIRSKVAREKAFLAGAFLAAVWLVLPVHASTVLYLVQRMAQLSTLFILLGLVFFVHARGMIQNGSRWGNVLLWVGVPAATVLGVLSKENGALLPVLALVVELVWFRRAAAGRRPLQVKVFFLLTAIVPVTAALLLLLLRPDSFFAGYRMRHFTLYERLLTQPRVLWDYVQAIVLPRGALYGIFHDDYPVSHGLLAPWTTLAAIVAWLAALVGAWMAGRASPLIVGGLLLFLVGQSMESSIFPLEIYFEHRNYFPSIGVLLALAGIVQFVATRLPAPSPGFRRLLPALALMWPLVCVAVTFNQAAAWSDTDSFYRYQFRHHADSVRLHSYMLGFALQRGDFLAASAHIDAADRLSPVSEPMAPAIWQLLAYCSIDQPPEPVAYSNIELRVESAVSRYAMIAVEQLATRSEKGECPGLDVDHFGNLITRWLDHSELPDAYMEKWRSRYYLSRMFASVGDFESALELGTAAWQDSDYNRGVGVYLFQINASVGNEAACTAILKRLERSTGHGDLLFDRAVNTFRRALDEGLEALPDEKIDLTAD